MLIGLCGDKGAPGVTASALAIASAWPGPAIVVEASPAGGDLAIRLRPKGSVLPETPTVLSVVTAARGTDWTDAVANHSHGLNSTTTVVPGPALAEQFTNIGDWAPLADALSRSSVPVFADLGHLHGASATIAVAARADLVVVVSRPDIASVVRVRERLIRAATDLARMRGTAPRLFPLLVSTSRHGQADVADLSAVLAETPARPFLVDAGFLAHDPAAVRRIEAGEEPTGRLARTALMRTARVVASQIERIATAPAQATAGSASGAGS
jgi:MinD-like ATPase involved in chromosome partitioning or flagellar assembly